MENINLKKMSKSDLQLLIEEASKEIKRPRLTREEKTFLSFFKTSSIQITDDYIYIIFGEKDEKEISTLIPKNCLSGVSFNDLQLYKTYMISDLVEFNITTLTEFFDNEEIVGIHCDTEEKANILCKAFNKMGKTWITAESYLDKLNWGWHRENTCYGNDGCISSISYYKGKNIKLYEFEDIDLEGYDN